jgi:flagellar basal body-associated protein FliL
MSESPIDLSDENDEPSEKKALTWVILAVVVVVFGVAGAWIMHSKSSGTQAELTKLQEELKQDKVTMDEERDKVFEITERLNALKQAIALRQVPDHEKAVADYNKLAAEQRAQREKVKDLAAQFNTKLTRANELQ